MARRKKYSVRKDQVLKTFLFLTLSIIVIYYPLYSQTTNYYPLKIGNEWKYQSENGNFEQKFIVVDYDEDYKAYLVKQILKLGTLLPVSNQLLLENRNNNIIKLGSQGGLLNTDWQFATNIILSNDLSVGSKWKEDYEGMNDKVVADTLTVRVKAGIFSNVIKIKRTTIDFNKKSKKKYIPLVVFDYYAANVGLIKETSYDAKKHLESIYIELVDYNLK